MFAKVCFAFPLDNPSVYVLESENSFDVSNVIHQSNEALKEIFARR